MMRTLLLGALGLVLAVAVGIGIHLVTRDTIALPVVRLEQQGSLAPPRAATTTGATTAGTTSGASTETGEDDGSGRGRGRGRGRGGDD